LLLTLLRLSFKIISAVYTDSKFNDVDIDQYPGESSINLQTPTTRSYGININFTF